MQQARTHNFGYEQWRKQQASKKKINSMRHCT
jgi:hypothetical protein